jgi:hypothetical protein
VTSYFTFHDFRYWPVATDFSSASDVSFRREAEVGRAAKARVSSRQWKTLALSIVSFPPEGIASRALIARLTKATSNWFASTSTCQRPGVPTVSIWTVSPSDRWINSAAPTRNLYPSVEVNHVDCVVDHGIDQQPQATGIAEDGLRRFQHDHIHTSKRHETKLRRGSDYAIVLMRTCVCAVCSPR